MQKVLITGGSGLVGRQLIKSLVKRGVKVHNLSRSKQQIAGVKTFLWDYKNDFIDPNAFEGVDTVYHLAGASVADKKWTAQRKKELVDSRIKTANLLFTKISKLENRPRRFISASGISFYGYGLSNYQHTEKDKLGNGFLAELTQQWENVARQFSSLGLQVVSLRIGVVLTPAGGALEKMAKPVKLCVGSPLGTGKQPIPWIHVNDLVNAFLYSADKKLQGIFNAVSGSNPSNKELTQAIAKTLNKPIWFPSVPSVVLKLMLGQLAEEIVLNGVAVSNKKLTETGFQFEFTELNKALVSCLN